MRGDEGLARGRSSKGDGGQGPSACFSGGDGDGAGVLIVVIVGEKLEEKVLLEIEDGPSGVDVGEEPLVGANWGI